MRSPGDYYTHPVHLAGSDSTRVRRGQDQTLTLFPAGLRLVRRGAVTYIPWHDLTAIELTALHYRSTAKAWALISRSGAAVFPHEFDPNWTAGPIGWWLHRFRPDLPLPSPDSLAPLPLGIPNRQIPLVVLPGVVIGIIAMTLTTGVAPLVAVVSVIGCVAAILLMVVSPRWARATRYTMLGLIGLIMLITFAGSLLL